MKEHEFHAEINRLRKLADERKLEVESAKIYVKDADVNVKNALVAAAEAKKEAAIARSEAAEAKAKLAEAEIHILEANRKTEEIEDRIKRITDEVYTNPENGLKMAPLSWYLKNSFAKFDKKEKADRTHRDKLRKIFEQNNIPIGLNYKDIQDPNKMGNRYVLSERAVILTDEYVEKYLAKAA